MNGGWGFCFVERRGRGDHTQKPNLPRVGGGGAVNERNAGFQFSKRKKNAEFLFVLNAGTSFQKGASGDLIGGGRPAG